MAMGDGPAGPASAVQSFVGEVVSTVTAPIDALNLGVAQATLAALQFLPKMPAGRLFQDLVFHVHSHPHPPSFGFPLPSFGPVLASGCWGVLINGTPAARNGDLGLSVWCGGYFPIFELITGSSHVFIGGARASRAFMDLTLHCLPDPLGGKWGIGKLDIAMALFGVGMSALNVAASAEQQVSAESKSATAQEASADAAFKAEIAEAFVEEVGVETVADAEMEAAQAAAAAESAAASAAAAAVGTATAAAQLAADVAAAAMGLLMGKDPGVGFPFGMMITGSPNVLIGGFPMPGWDLIMKGLLKALRPAFRKIQLKLPPGRLRNALCAVTGHPVEIASGRMYTNKIDFEIEGRIPIIFERTYDTSAIDRESSLGWGWTHPYDEHIWFSTRYNCIIWRDKENRQVRFDKLGVGESYFQPLERVSLTRNGESSFELFDHKSGLTTVFGKISDNEPDAEENALKMLYIRDRNDNRLTLDYTNGRLTEIANNSGVFVSLHYHEFDGKVRLAEIRKHLRNGRDINLVSYGYDGIGELQSVTDRTYVPYTFQYDDHLMTRETNRNGLSFYFEYEGTGQNARCVKTWGDGGIYERNLSYSPQARITKVVDGLGGTTVYHYNELDLVTKIFDANGGLFQMEYGQTGELVKEIDEQGFERTYSYDEFLNTTSVVQEDGTSKTVEYNKFSQPESVTDEQGGRWLREFDDNGNITATINPLGSRREYEYNSLGDVTKIRDAVGNFTSLSWTAAGQINSVVRPRGGEMVYAYTDHGTLFEVLDRPTGLRTQYQYDELVRVSRITEINSRSEKIAIQRFEYDAQSNLTGYTDALGHVTKYKYSGYDKLSERVDALGYARKFAYDVEERLTKITNERGEDYRFEYDLLDNIVAKIGFDGAKSEYQYDLKGNLTSQKDALKRETFYRRDPMGRVLSRLHSDSTEFNYAYDVCGRLARAESPDNVVELEYNAVWQVTTEDQNGTRVNYEYDAEGRRIKRLFESGEGSTRAVEYDFDAESNLTAFKVLGKTFDLDYDLAGRLTNRSAPNGVQDNFEYDVNGRLSSQSVSVGGGRDLVKRGYEWDALGNIVGMNDSLRGERRYSYDPVERLKRVERMISGEAVKTPIRPDEKTGYKSDLPEDRRLWRADDPAGTSSGGGRIREIEEFQYDGDGNLTLRKSNVRGERKFAYGKGDKLEQQNKIQYIYDVVGNLIQKRFEDGSMVSYDYDADNQLRSVSGGAAGRVEFLYDAFGRRTLKVANSGITKFYWDGDALLSEAKDAQTSAEYIHQGFVPVAKIVGTEIETYHTDYLGTPKEVTNSSGEVVWQGNYDEYGRVNEVVAKTDQNIRFQGQYEDDETGLYYNRFRYYDADGCRYINQDPIQLFGGTNFYEYTSNPTVWIDPLGWIKAPAGLPNGPGIYILIDPKTKTAYVGQGVNMNDRISSTTHKKAQKLLGTKGVVVQFIAVDLGSAATDADKRRILSRYEQIELDKQRSRGYTMLNSIEAEQPKKRKRNQDLIDEHGASGKKRRKTC